jgi:hypothetical protein
LHVDEARTGRLRAFDNAAQPMLNASLASHSFEGLYDRETEEIVLVLDVSEITGLPSSLDHVHINGSIAVALIRPKANTSMQASSVVNLQQPGIEPMAFDDGRGPRLLFSVSSGTLTFAAQEDFLHAYLVCCQGFDGGCLKTSMMGSHVMDYSMTSHVEGQVYFPPLFYSFYPSSLFFAPLLYSLPQFTIRCPSSLFIAPV